MKLVEKKLEELYIVKDGTHDSPKYVSAENGFPFLTSKNLKKGFIDLTEVDYVSEEDYKKINLRSKVDKGDLLFAMIGTIGNPVVVEEEPNFAIKNVALFKKNTDSNSLHYLKYILSSESFKKKLINDSTGGTQKFVSLGYLRKLKIPIPEKLSDQIRIAQILSQAESLIAQRKQSIGLLDELLKSTFLEMFGDPVRNEKGWEISNIGKQCDVKGGKRIPKESKLVEENTGYPYIKAGNIKKGKITTTDLEYLTPEVREQLKKYIVERGDVCITVVGANIGDVGIVPEELHLANLTENANKLLIKDKRKINNIYLGYYLMMDFVQNNFNSNIRAAGVPKLAIFRIEQVELLMPPIELQTKFANIVEKVETLKTQYQQSLAELQNMYGVLSQKAFKGELKGNVEITN